MGFIKQISFLFFLFALTAFAIHAQTTQFTYQGKLTDGGTAASTNYDMTFRLFDDPTAGSQIGSSVNNPTVQVLNGIFTVQLDFGSAAFSGADRYLEVNIRPAGSSGGFQQLLPRRKITSAPYSIQSLNATTTITAVTATNATQLGGLPASQYVLTGDLRLTDARPPTSGSISYIQNATSQQASSNFNISGNGTVGGTLSGNAVDTATQYNIAGIRVLTVSGVGLSANSNTFAGNETGTANLADDTGNGSSNSFFGQYAGNKNTTGYSNSFVGVVAGFSNTTGNNNSFVGVVAGRSTTTGGYNSFVGAGAGFSNTTGSNNTAIGSNANVGTGSLSFATALGAQATVSTSNTVVLGRSADTVRIPGNLIVTGSISKGSGSFRIDHPLDPANKYLYHSFVESPDMMNIYNGNATTDDKGEATIVLPDYFQALNRDFRYQLTVIGQFAQAIVGEEIKSNSFKIKTDKPNVKVSWQVTGIRHDKYAEDNRIPTTEDKPADERGKCLYEAACGEILKK
jgi:hypothetical protein